MQRRRIFCRSIHMLWKEAREAAILCRELKANSMVGEKKYGGDIYAMELARPAGIGQQLRVYARPAWRARNPYPGMLADELVAQGVPVSELSDFWPPVPGEKKRDEEHTLTPVTKAHNACSHLIEKNNN